MSTVAEILTPIWEKVLQRSPISSDDNFFDLGGDSTLALKLFTEIAQVCGRELPPVMIYQSPTIATLAAALEQPKLPQFQPLVLLKAGTASQPIFVTHGMGGNVMDFFQVVKNIDSEKPIYGMQPRGLDGVEEPFDRVEDMAQFFLDTIRSLQPNGPYFLVGYSLGGLVVLEMAQRLVERGEKVALLALLESYPDKGFLPLSQRIGLLFMRIKNHASVVMGLRPSEVLTYFTNPAERVAHLSRSGSRNNPDRLPLDVWFTPAIVKMRDRAFLALKRYKPRYYPGKISFVRAEVCTEFPRDPAKFWTHLAADLEVETVPGNHQGIMNTHFERLGEVLSTYLRKAAEPDRATK